jgi:hypothetical protein
MHMNSRRARRDRVRASLWAAVALCAGVPDAAANDLVHIMPSVWDAAAALSLTLIAALMGSEK